VTLSQFAQILGVVFSAGHPQEASLREGHDGA
jgi:hypothetical protein